MNADTGIIVNWDDSLLSDPVSEKASDMQAVTIGIMTAWEFRVKWYGDTEEEPKRIIAEEKKRLSSGISDLFNNPSAMITGNNNNGQ